MLNLFYNVVHLLILAVLGLCCCENFSLVLGSGGNSLVVVYGLLIAVAFRGARALGCLSVSSCRFQALEHRLSSCGA